MERRILAPDRMSEAELWMHALRCLGELWRAQVGELTFVERKALAKRALECVAELYTRGHQLELHLGVQKQVPADAD